MAERTPERLVRLLGLVAYLDRHPGVSVEEVAEHFEVTPQQVMRDVDTLWVSGTPGYWPDDLIDFDATSLESGVLELTQSRGMTRALRLGTREAVALIAALRAVAEAVGDALDPDEREVLRSTLATLSAATGEAAAAMDVQLAVEGTPQVLTTLRSALRARSRVRLRYVNASDTTSERVVDPWQILTGDEHSYLQAWCHRSGEERLFRLDRILAVEPLDEPVSTEPGPAPPVAYRPSREHEQVVLELDGQVRWVAEQFPADELVELPDGGFRVTLRVGTRTWLEHLLLRVSPSVRTVSPVDAALAAAEAAGRALAAYQATGAGTEHTQ